MSASVSEAIMHSAEQTNEDLIATIAAKIEQLGQSEVFDLIPSLIEGVDRTYFELGGALARVSDEGWWKEKGYDSFKACIEQEFALQYRKGMYLMNIYNSLVESEIPWSKVSTIGWTKLKEIVSILTPENVDEWVEKAEGLTVLQLQEAVKAATVGSLASGNGHDVVEEAKISTLTFKVHADQRENIEAALEKAKGEAETDVNSVALEAICINYLSGKKSGKPKSLLAILGAYQPEEVLNAFAARWPDIDVNVTM